MKKTLKAFLLILSVLLVLSIAVSCDKPTEQPDDPPVDDDPIEEITDLKIDTTFRLLRSDDDKMGVKGADYIRTAIIEVFGIEVDFETDFISRKETINPEEHVILVGPTNRPASTYEENLKSKDYRYCVPNEKTIVISGTTEDSIYQAAVKFCEDMFGYTGKGSGTGTPKDIPIGSTYVYHYNYPVNSFSICGIPASEFTIMYTNNEFQKAAEELSLTLADLSGEQIPLKSSKNCPTSHGIYFKSTVPAGTVVVDYSIVSKDGNIYFDVSGDMAQTAVSTFFNQFVDAQATGDYDINVPQSSYIGLAIEDDFNGLVYVKTQITEEIAPGVTYSLLEYKGSEGEPVLAYVVTAAPGSVKAVCGTPGADDKLNGTLQLVGDQAVAAEAKYGFNILAAANADLFFYDPDLQARSMNVKDGVKISSNTGPFKCFAVMKDGSYYVGNPDLVKESDVVQMVGGHCTIVENGHIVFHDHGDPFHYVRHPRTAVGYKEDGTLVMIVVDGRQPDLSNGASLHDMGLILRSMDVYAAVNLDGGGSSTLLTKNATTGEFDLRNSPSDHDPYRPVLTTIFFVQNKDYHPDEK